MIQDILNTCWDDWREDHHPKDRRMMVVAETLPGYDMGVENTRFLINEIVRRVGGVYLEVGVWVGHSLMSAAVFNPEVTCLGIENFSAHPDRQRLEKNLKVMPTNAEVLKGSFEDIIPTLTDLNEKVGVYYYDGNHAMSATLLGLYMAQPLLAPHSYILLDDMVLNQARHAKDRFVRANKEWEEIFCIIPPRELVVTRTYRNWYNGFCILEKK